MKRYVLAITGATGPAVGLRILRELAKTSEVHTLISRQSFSIIRAETGVDLEAGGEVEIQAKLRDYAGSDQILYHAEHNFEAPVASGSFRTDGMFVVPCSMKTLAGIASGYANNLVERAADVTLKEGRPLVLSPREMPFSAIHLENMLKLARLGVRIAPPVVSFYHKPGGLDELIDFIAGRILDAMGIGHEIYRRWGT
ncbi:MAG: UbiX family flavin prenyltransferase [Nitrospiraceae bacterium]|nr:UbiX family flavin prenyltransferase [Nitrospiraceae bacterium]